MDFHLSLLDELFLKFTSNVCGAGWMIFVYKLCVKLTVMYLVEHSTLICEKDVQPTV